MMRSLGSAGEPAADCRGREALRSKVPPEAKRARIRAIEEAPVPRRIVRGLIAILLLLAGAGWAASDVRPGAFPAGSDFHPRVGSAVSGLHTDAGGDPVYQEILVPAPNSPADRARLFFHPDLEIMGLGDGELRLLSRPELTRELEARGIPVRVLIPDLEARYAAQCHADKDYGVWHTYESAVQEMNAIHAQYPQLSTAPISIGTTGEGRTIWAMKVATDPEVETDKPEVLIDGVHHAREIMALEVPLQFIRYLCAQYGSDPVITYLVNNRQIWFVPIVNPDGFVYNELTNPDGGGMWRKNRRDNGNGCFGVDNNRNYPYVWIGAGSSADPCDDTYRGPSPGSEPENQAMMTFIDQHHFTVWLSYHSNAAMVLFPWGNTTDHTPDDDVFRAAAAQMAAASGYAIGQAPEILYQVNGDANDWGYGAVDAHQKIFAFTTEIGGSGFWPDPSERDGLIAENLPGNIYLCQAAGPYLNLTGVSASAAGGGDLMPGETGTFGITVQNISPFAEADQVRATLRCSDPYVALIVASAALGVIPAAGSGGSGSAPFQVAVNPNCPAGRSVTFTVHLEGAGGLTEDETSALTIGQPPTLYADTFEQSGSEWLRDPTENCVTGTFVRIKPVKTNDQPGTDTTPHGGYAWVTAQNPNGDDGVDDVDGGIAATRSPVIDLSAVAHAQLDMNYFFGQANTGDDPTGDYFRIDLSNDGGATFPVNLVSIGDVRTAPIWRNLKVNLETLLPLTARMVIRVQASDGPAAGDIIEGGIDDIYIYNRKNSDEPPAAPSLLSPANGSVVSRSPILTVSNATDPEGDPLTYGFAVYADSDLTVPVLSIDGVSPGAGTTSWTVAPPLPNGAYWWRAYAADPNALGLCMTAASFTVNDSTGARAPSAIPPLAVNPNPAVGSVLIRYYTPSVPSSRVEIVDASGRRIQSFDGARWTTGWHEIVWDGRDSGGRRAPAGVYWVRLILPGEVRTVRMVRIP